MVLLLGSCPLQPPPRAPLEEPLQQIISQSLITGQVSVPEGDGTGLSLGLLCVLSCVQVKGVWLLLLSAGFPIQSEREENVAPIALFSKNTSLRSFSKTLSEVGMTPGQKSPGHVEACTSSPLRGEPLISLIFFL